MKTPRILAASAALLLSQLHLHALTDTWDGGGADNNIATNLNWLDNTAPLSDLVNTDLIFDGTVRLTPNFSAGFSTDSITFNSNAAVNAFTLGGSALTVGLTGIVNNDAQTQTFNNQVVVGTATTVFNSAVGPLTFSSLSLGANSVTFNGTSGGTIQSVSGTGTITRTGGSLTIGTNVIATQVWDLAAIGGSNVTIPASDYAVQTTGSISVNNSTLSLSGNLSMDGTPLSLAGGSAAISVAAARTLALLNGGSLTVSGSSFTQSAGSTVSVNGTGSLINTGTGGYSLAGSGTVLNATNGASVSVLNLNVGQVSSSATFDSNSTLTATSGTSSIGNGGTGTITFATGATGAFGALQIATSGAGNGQLIVQSGASVTTNGSLLIADDAIAGQTGSLAVNGATAVFSLATGGSFQLGSTSLSSGTISLLGGTFNTGVGASGVNATGSIAINNGTFNANGNLTLLGGQMTRDATGSFNLAAGKNLTMQLGGDFIVTGSFTQANTGSFIVSGVGSNFTATSGMTFNGGSSVQVALGGFLSPGLSSPLTIGSSGSGAVTVDGAGSTVLASGLTLGGNALAANGTLTLSNGGNGSFGAMVVGNSTLGGTSGTLNVQSGATLTASNLSLGAVAAANTATATVNGAGSTLTLGGGSSVIGTSSANTATLNVQNGGVFNSGTGTMTVNTTGTIAIAGGTYNSGGTLSLNGQLTRNGAGALNLALGASLNIQNGGDAIITGLFQQVVRANLLVNGLGATFSTTGDFQWEGANSTLSILQIVNGASLTSGGSLHLGRTNSAVSMTVFGAGSNISASPFFTSEWQAGVLLGNNATATLGALRLADSDFGSAASSSLTVQSGATVSVGHLSAATAIASNTAAISVDGAGSAITQTGASTFSLGSVVLSSGTLTVSNGGSFTSGTGTVTLYATSAITLNGGNLTFAGPLNRNGGTITFNSGAFSIIDNWVVTPGGLLGPNVTLDASKRMTTTGTTGVDAFQTLTINGGTLTTGALVNAGTIAFTSGTLAITGAGGFNIGTGALGANVTLGAGANLQVTNTATIAGGATLTLNGGTAGASALNNSGTLRANLGTAGFGGVTNGSGGRIFVSDTLTANGGWANTSGSQLTLENSGLVNGTGLILNSGLITGDGTIATALTNASGGEVRGEFGKTLTFTGTTGANAGRVNLLGGTVSFAQQFTNSATGQINGQGALYFPTTPVPSSVSPNAGLMNAGSINLSGGDSQIFGTVQMQAGSRLIVSGGATASFFDVFRHSGAEVKASAGSNIVFFGDVRGAGGFTGTGTIYFEAGYAPGNSPALVTFGGDVVYGSFLTNTMEIGGTVRGTQYDALNVAGKMTYGGTLNVVLISGFQPVFGNVFNLYDFGTRAGSFATVNLPALTTGLLWDQTNLQSAGELQIGLDLAIAGRVWDGGGANNAWSTNNNWSTDVQPLNNGAASLVFAGNTRLSPSVDTPWNVAVITFDNTAGAFTISGPQGITLGAGGITNNDTQTQTITAAITLSAGETFNAAAGDLAISSVALAGQTLALAGANDVALGGATGSGTINKNNAGRFDVTGALGTGGVVLNANAGTTNIGVSETLAALTIGNGATVTLGAIPPFPAPEFGTSVQPVPEPGTLALLAAASLALFRRRRD